MIEEHIKEAISLRYMELIAADSGYKTASSYPDYGTDLEIKEVGFRPNNDKKRYLETGRELKLQLKATTEASISYEGNDIKYDLKSDTYNDLIQRKNSKTPLILILFILPLSKDEWLSISDKELIIKKCAYWFIPDNSDSTNNSSTIRISINKENNLIKKDTLNFLFEKYS
jgi:hypothetical protein